MLKMDEGLWYPLYRSYHLTFMEVPVAIEQIGAGDPALGQRLQTPTATCETIAKRDLAAGPDSTGSVATCATGSRTKKGPGCFP
jgi:predicted homoserine dehydrogenase-like protein